MIKQLLLALSFLMFGNAHSQDPIPTKEQLQWHSLEFYLFMHFGPNTFTDKEWGHGNETEDVFNPTAMDCRQWCRIAKQCGAKGIIITAKHHDGFCLWPSKYSTHTVRESKWKSGHGDVLKELSDACREFQLKFGVYISPWDRNHPQYGTDAYNEVYQNTMKEIFARYGNIFELWWDGANGEGPNGKKQVYRFGDFEKTIKKISPSTLIFSDIGPHIRWVGNENGFAGKTNWNMLDTMGFGRGATGPKTSILNSGQEFGKSYIPAECDVSIRPGWFYHQEEDNKVKTPEQLFDLYLKSVGRGSNLLLNVPPDRRGLINENDSASLIGFKNLRDQNFSKDLLSDAHFFLVENGKEIKKLEKKSQIPGGINISLKDLKDEAIKIRLPTIQKINCIVIKENLAHAQSVAQFYVLLKSGLKVQTLMETTIGNKRILTFPAMDIQELIIEIVRSKKQVEIAGVQAYLIAENLIEK